MTRALVRRRALAATGLWIPLLAIAAGAGFGAVGLVGRSSTAGLLLRLALPLVVGALALRARADGGPYFRGLLVTLLTLAFTLGAWLG